MGNPDTPLRMSSEKVNFVICVCVAVFLRFLDLEKMKGPGSDLMMHCITRPGPSIPQSLAVADHL